MADQRDSQDAIEMKKRMEAWSKTAGDAQEALFRRDYDKLSESVKQTMGRLEGKHFKSIIIFNLREEGGSGSS